MAKEADERASGWIEGARLDLGGLCYVGPSARLCSDEWCYLEVSMSEGY